MKIKAELLLASHNLINQRTLYTFKLTYPRIILAEVNTHRMFSRNTASSRAIPSKKFRKLVLEQPFIPTSIGQYQAGMQAGQELEGWRRWACEKVYAGARYPQVFANWLLEKLGAHKQVQNRLVEPWMWVEQIVSATEWDNFLSLRNHKAAEPHIQEVAFQISNKIKQVKAYISGRLDRVVNLDEYGFDEDVLANTEVTDDILYAHTPLVTVQEYCSGMPVNDLMQISAARCARVSYYLPDSTKPSNIESDRKLIEKLSGSHPKHLSPFEHQAYFTSDDNWYGNFRGWNQYRKTIVGESGENSKR